MKNRRKLDLSVTPLDSADWSSKQEQERKTNNANAAKLMSTPKTKNVTGFDTRPFRLGTHDGLSNLGMSNAPNSNVKS